MTIILVKMTLFGSRFSGTEGGEEKEYGFCVCCGAEVLGGGKNEKGNGGRRMGVSGVERDGQIGVSGGDLG
ncbi:hypothetical protein F2Q69_00036951 [Brassica cretica]|uniref:FLZ-type domain-containing protein n=3 Tax=Brassica TaxID=3705 RepID=A0A8S9SMG1_BRACR|nr:hypothetical protein DY000_02041486 [Brassica cretica]KAF3603182.1 hypothetical protein F2Q69_00036951 [Brassica cretica]